MIVRDLEKDVLNTNREVSGPGWTSRRLILKADGMGHSLHDTVIDPDAELHLHYKNHYETVYLTHGHGTITNLETDKVHKLRPGVVYALNENDKHILKAGSDGLRMVCAFTPPLSGEEVHGKDGAYPLIEDE